MTYRRVLDGSRYVSDGDGRSRLLMLSFTLTLTNVAGILKHSIRNHFNDPALPRYASLIRGASPTLAATPTVGVGTGFGGVGVGVWGINKNVVVFDTTAQDFSECVGDGGRLIFNSTANAGIVGRFQINSFDVNGVAVNRPTILFSVDGSGAAFNIDNVNIPVGTIILVRCNIQVSGTA